MSRTLLLMVSLVCAVLMFGCATTENTNNSNSNSNSAAPGSEKSGSAPSSATPGSTTASSDDKIGVPECDDFLAKYDSCTSKVPEIVRAQYENAGKQMREQWKKLAESPQTKGSLAAACKQAVEQQAAAWKLYGCAN